MRTEDSTEPARCLSDYWRVDRSADRSRELSSVLGGAATQAELVQHRLRSAEQDAATPLPSPVILDPRLLSGFAAPIPGLVVDCIVGIAVRQAAMRELSVASSEWSGWEELDEESRNEFARFHHTLEEMYIVRRLRRLSPTLVEYLRTMRRTLLPWRNPARSNDTGVCPSRNMVLGAWVGWRLYGETRGAESDANVWDMVGELDTRARVYLKERDSLKRVELAGKLWEWLSRLPRDASPHEGRWCDELEGPLAEEDTLESQRQLRRNAQGGADPGGLLDMTGISTPVPANHSGDWPEEEGASSHEVQFVTGELREMGVRAAVTAIRHARYDPIEHERALRETAREIESVRHLFSRLEESRTRWRYGLPRGKLDGRALTKAAAGKDHVFKRRDRRGGCSLALVFLVDVSASMRSHMPVVNRASCVVAEALGPLAPRVWFEILTYTSAGLQQGAPVRLTRLASTGSPLSLREVWMEGGTPSGEAIAAAMLELRRRTAERKLVLHFTDGHPKDSYVVRQALELGRRMGVDVLTISIAAPQEGLYGAGKCEVAYSVSELPQVLARLLPRLYH